MMQEGKTRPRGTVLGLTDADRRTLLELARRAVGCAARHEPLPRPGAVAETLRQHCGAFVTLKSARGELRGCIGALKGTRSLALTVAEMARAAAVEDPRFEPVVPDEVDALRIEISVLSPFEPLEPERFGEIEVGLHGLYIVKGNRAGLLLPQVATEHEWDREKFLEQTCWKAGLPQDAHRRGATVYRFAAEVFGEDEPALGRTSE
jgi:AmmeMemoRadiSam system protein A